VSAAAEKPKNNTRGGAAHEEGFAFRGFEVHRLVETETGRMRETFDETDGQTSQG